VQYKGEALKVGKSYYWKVRIWDEENRVVDYSDAQKFTVGESENNMISTANIQDVSRIRPQVFEKNGEVYFIDFGKAAFGTIEFNYQADQADTLIFRIGEMADGQTVNRNPPAKSHIRYQEIAVAVDPEKSTYQLPIQKDTRNTLPGVALPLPEGTPD
jgi:hypothetical protein